MENITEILAIGYIPEIVTGINPHNMILTSLIDVGILGPLYIFILFFYILKRLFRLLTVNREKRDLYFLTVLACLGAFAGILFKSIFEYSIFYKNYFGSVMLSMIFSMIIVFYESSEINNGRQR